jgi:hypothetical protein
MPTDARAEANTAESQMNLGNALGAGTSYFACQVDLKPFSR